MAPLPPHVTKLIINMVYEFQRRPLPGSKIIGDYEAGVEHIRLKVEGPDGTPFSNGSFELKLSFTNAFPISPPKAYFKTPIFHPNVQQQTGEVCISSLKKDWNPQRASLKNIMLCIFSLLHAPNPQSALNADAASLLQENYEAFCARAKSLTNIHARQERPNKKLPTVTDNAFEKILSTKVRKQNSLKRIVGKTSKNKLKGKKKKSLRRL